jgi:Domain of unknown function (DUF1707)/Cell wall-active antibiotics response 4TMS YvqF
VRVDTSGWRLPYGSASHTGNIALRTLFVPSDTGAFRPPAMPDTPVSNPLPVRSDGDARDRTVARLSEAYANDMLSMGELELRMEAVYRAGTQADLDRLTADLPTSGNPGAVAASGLVRGARQKLTATFSSNEGVHFAVMPALFEIRALFGSVELDLRHTFFHPGVTEISIDANFGNIELVLPAHVVVERHGDYTFCSYSMKDKGFKRRDLPLPVDAPIVRFTGQAFLSNIEIKRVIR